MALGELHHCIQVKIDESLETFSAEQRFHGERLDTIESLGRGLCGVVFFAATATLGSVGMCSGCCAHCDVLQQYRRSGAQIGWSCKKHLKTNPMQFSILIVGAFF